MQKELGIPPPDWQWRRPIAGRKAEQRTPVEYHRTAQGRPPGRYAGRPRLSPVKLALDRLKDLSADANARRRALHDEVSDLRAEREKGKLEGEALTLERLITKRFGPLPADVAQQINAAGAEQIEACLDLVLDAAELVTIFPSKQY